MKKILITGANGQLGTVLTSKLREKWGQDQVLATDIRSNDQKDPYFEQLDVTDERALLDIITTHQITEIYHMAAILSARGEQAPLQTWDINMKTFFNVLEVAVKTKIDKVFFPSSIAVYGPEFNGKKANQSSIRNAHTVYGISKIAGEQWAQYYHEKYNLDIRSIRYPGVIGYQSLPGGGTTDYAVDIFHKAVNDEAFTCFLKSNTTLPMIFMEDAIRATIELMEAPKETIKVRTSYNLSGISFSPEELVSSIRKIYPNFSVSYTPDYRQGIAETWPDTIDDREAREDWNWEPAFDITRMTVEMLEQLKNKSLHTV